MSEAILQADLQRELLRLTSLFSAGDVTINDWSVLDGSSANAPFVVIEVADDFDSNTENTWLHSWTIPFTLIVRFEDWDDSSTALRNARQTIIDALRDTTHYHASSSLLAWGLRGMSAGTGISEIYDKYNENAVESLPVYLSQAINLAVEETNG